MFADRVFETTIITGTGPYTLQGAQSDYDGFADAFANGDIVAYHCRNADASAWESGWGVLDTGAGTITRNVLRSSSGTSLINWGAGTKSIYSWPASAVLKSMLANHIGTSRKPFLPAGALWPHSGDNLLRYYNGSADVPVLPLVLGSALQVLRVNAGGTAVEYADPATGLKPGASSELTIASGAVTATGSYHSVDTEADAAADDLDTITVTALAEGQLLLLKAEDPARVVTVKDGSGNITLGGGDYDLNTAAKRILLQKVGSNLVEVARSEAAGVTAGAAQASTSGSALDFTDIPAGTKRITVQFAGVSLSGTDNVLVQIGDSGGLETSGYVSTSTAMSGGGNVAVSATAGFIIFNNTSAVVLSGTVVLTLLDEATNTWVANGNLKFSGTTVVAAGGNKALSATLDRLRITRDGTDTFDAGQVNILYEG